MNFVKPTSVVVATAETLSALQPRRKWPISYSSVSVIAMTFDIVIILLSGVVSGALYHFEVSGNVDVIPQYLGSAAVIAALYVSVMKGQDLYSPAKLLAFKIQVSAAITTWLGVFLFLSGAVFALKIGSQFSRGAIFSFAITGLALLIVQRVLDRELLRHGLEEQRFSGRNAVLITDQGPTAESAVASTLLKHGFQLHHQFVIPVRERDPRRQNELISDIVDYLRGSRIEEVIVSIDVKHWEDLSKLFIGLRKLPLPVTLIPVGGASDILRRPSYVMGNSVCIDLQRGPLSAFERGVKRAIDLVGAFAGLIALLPLLIFTAVAIKLDSPGPILFRQRRCGFNDREFRIFKFRTMTVLEDGPTVDQAAQSDSRVTRVGKWLRRMSIDELPQLLNVLNGSMSLVGPRPHAVTHHNHFNKLIGNYAFRHHVKPGLTGWAQVNGHRGATPTPAEIKRRVEFDLWYIDNWSLRLDFLIMLRTFVEVIRARNAY